MDPLGRQLLLQVILILINAFFASAEIAVLSLNTGKISKLAKDGDKKAEKMMRLIDQPSGFLSTIQIGITLAGFLASAFAAENFSDRLVDLVVNKWGFTLLSVKAVDTVSVIVITLILSYFTLVFGELVPKRIAMQRPMSVAKLGVGFIGGLEVFMKPLVWMLSASTNGILRILRLKTGADEEPVTEEEIMLMVDIGEEKGTINTGEREMIENIFDFGDTTAEDVMTHSVDVEMICIDDDPEDIIKTIKNSGLSRFPVYDDDINDICGILIAKEYLINLQNSKPKSLKSLVRPAYFVPESVHTDVLFRNMQHKKQHLAIVVDEYGGTSGIVTMEDLLEEIVGNIYDELDPQSDQIFTKLGDNTWRVSGALDIDTFCDKLQIELPDDIEFDTVGGLVFSRLHDIPEDGETVDIEAYGLQIHADKIEDRRVESAIIKKLELEEEKEEEEDD